MTFTPEISLVLSPSLTAIRSIAAPNPTTDTNYSLNIDYCGYLEAGKIIGLTSSPGGPSSTDVSVAVYSWIIQQL
jgi:hypothetical protein